MVEPNKTSSAVVMKKIASKLRRSTTQSDHAINEASSHDQATMSVKVGMENVHAGHIGNINIIGHDQYNIVYSYSNHVSGKLFKIPCHFTLCTEQLCHLRLG